MSDLSNASREPGRSIGASPGSIALKLALAWALVGIPLAWGVWQVFKKSLDLFR